MAPISGKHNTFSTPIHVQWRIGLQAAPLGYTHGSNGLVTQHQYDAMERYLRRRRLLHRPRPVSFRRGARIGKIVEPQISRGGNTGTSLRAAYGVCFYVLPDGGYGHGGAPEVNGELHILPHSDYVLVALTNRDPRMATNMVDFIISMLPIRARGSNGHA